MWLRRKGRWYAQGEAEAHVWIPVSESGLIHFTNPELEEALLSGQYNHMKLGILYKKCYSMDQNSVYSITMVWLVLTASDSVQTTSINPHEQDTRQGYVSEAHKVLLLYTAVPQCPWAPNRQPTWWGGWRGERKLPRACFSGEKTKSQGYQEGPY